MSCRVAAKAVEESLFNWLISINKEIKVVKIRFIPTKRNLPIQKKFNEMGFSLNNKTPPEFLLLESEVGPLFQENPIISVDSILK